MCNGNLSVLTYEKGNGVSPLMHVYALWLVKMGSLVIYANFFNPLFSQFSFSICKHLF